jgi:hypothetical protein
MPQTCRDLKALFPVLRNAEVWCEDGWYDLLFNFAMDLTLLAKERGLPVTVRCVKTKFGKFTVNYEFGGFAAFAAMPGARQEDWEAIASLTISYRDRSAATCEVCGRRGGPAWVGSRLWTLCLGCKP